MDNIKALKWRYATKKFDKSKTLSKERIEVLKNAFHLTATSYGLQPLKLIVIQDKPLQEKLLSYSLNQEQISTASHVLILCIEKRVDKDFIEKYFSLVHQIRSTPKEVLTPFKNFLIGDFENKPEVEIKAWAINQAYLALGTLLTVCATEAIDSCPMEGFEPEKYDELLGLDDMNLESVLVLPVGIRAKDDLFSEFKKVRRELSDVIIDLSTEDKA